jgi:hypothetical protein
MNEKEQLIREIEQASDFLVKEVLDFLLFTKSRTQYFKPSRDYNLETKLREMAEDQEVQAEINTINKEFLITEMDGLSST